MSLSRSALPQPLTHLFPLKSFEMAHKYIVSCKRLKSFKMFWTAIDLYGTDLKMYHRAIMRRTKGKKMAARWPVICKNTLF